MLSLWNTLYKTLVREYYRQNTGFLFLSLMFGFGILRPEDHIALSAYVFASPFLLLLVFGLWALYHLKTLFFVRQRFLWDSHSFLFELVLIPKSTRWLLLWGIQMMLWLPVLAYAAFVGYYGWKLGQPEAVIITAGYLLILPLTGVWAYEYRLFRPNPDTRLNQLSVFFNRRFTKPYWSYFVLYLFNKAPILLFLTKVFTCMVVVGVCKIYPTDSYDERLFSLAGAAIGMVQVVLLLHLYEFEHVQLPMLRNLPFTLAQRFYKYSGLFALLMLPETLFLFRYLPKGIGFLYIVEWFGLLISLLWLIFGRFLQKHHTMEHLLKLGIYTFIALYFVVMFRVPIFVIVALCLGSGIFLFHRHYYRSEYLIDSKALEHRPED
ncbi:hypothetical protein [Runella salmonicolor]|uniref:Uncharacterized protein n=1 Tax=Runella salmonicolor TaxID=2950278 RepID=A0ABT1FMP8_9BACT|nr:hypothetical protein [Runella salmonicolor]MCP1383006.1 hypothetical protein [Runella salmonicolor]